LPSRRVLGVQSLLKLYAQASSSSSSRKTRICASNTTYFENDDAESGRAQASEFFSSYLWQPMLQMNKYPEHLVENTSVHIRRHISCDIDITTRVQ
jgi:hypothetical protein